jgi:S1-C subfamily serine protease
MKKISIAMIVALVAISLPLIAGEGHKKCTAGTQECLDQMASNLKHRGLIGLEGEMTEQGYVVQKFIDGANAESAGLMKGDILVAVNGISITEQDAAKADSKNRLPGKIAKVTVLRGGEKHTMAVELVGMTEQQIAQAIGGHMIDHAEVTVASND